MHFFNSKYPDLDLLSLKHQQLSYLYLDGLDKHADRVLMIDSTTGSEWTGAKIKRIVLAIGAALVHEHDLKPGDVCGILYNNCDITIICYIAIILAGGTVAVQFDSDPYPEFRHNFGCISPKMLFSSSKMHTEMLQLRKDIDACFKIFWLDNKANLSLGELSNENRPVAYLEQLITYSNKTNIQTLPVECHPDMAAIILYTSGSTGPPKAVSRSRKNEAHICVSFSSANALWKLDQDTIQAGHLTLAHGTGTFCVHQTIVNGCKLIIQDRYNPELLLANIEKYKISSMMLGSARLQNLLLDTATVDKYNISSLTDIIAIGGKIPSTEVAIQFMERHPNCFVRQCYGISETGLVSLQHRDECRKTNPKAGELLPSVKVRLIDQDKQLDITELGITGELLIYSPFISPGYYGNYNKKSDAVFLADGGYKSGDIASISHDDQLQLEGRLSEVLCLDEAWRVCPEVIESVLLQHEWVKEAAVIGVPSRLLPGCHDPRAYVVLRSNYPIEVTEKSISDFVSERVSEPKRLHGGLKIINDFPRTSIGKINRKLLRELPEYK